MSLRIGVDVGGTNTDAVLMDNRRVVAKLKTPTTEDVTSGITTAIRSVLTQSGTETSAVASVMIGTTHFTNAIVERRHLEPVAVIRIGLPATAALPPMIDWPEDLVATIKGATYLVHGGYEFDGRKISEFDPAEIREAAAKTSRPRASARSRSAPSSPRSTTIRRTWRPKLWPKRFRAVTISKSNEIGRIGLLERENAAILNACLRGLADRTVNAFEKAIADLGISAPLYLTQNDGTLMAAELRPHLPGAYHCLRSDQLHARSRLPFRPDRCDRGRHRRHHLGCRDAHPWVPPGGVGRGRSRRRANQFPDARRLLRSDSEVVRSSISTP